MFTEAQLKALRAKARKQTLAQEEHTLTHAIAPLKGPKPLSVPTVEFPKERQSSDREKLEHLKAKAEITLKAKEGESFAAAFDPMNSLGATAKRFSQRG